MSSSPRHGSSASQLKHPKSSSTHSRSASQTPTSNGGHSLPDLPGRYYIPENELEEIILEMDGVHGSVNTDIRRIEKVKEHLDKYQGTQDTIERYKQLREMRQAVDRIHYMTNLKSEIVLFVNSMKVDEESENKDVEKAKTRASQLKNTLEKVVKVLETARSQLNDDTFNKKTLDISDGDKEEEMKAVCKEGKEKIKATRKFIKECDDEIKTTEETT